MKGAGGGCTLTINAQEQATNNLALYCGGYLEIEGGITLNCPQGFFATQSSHVATLGTPTETISVASGSQCEMDGEVNIGSGAFADLVVNCDVLEFDGLLEISIDGTSTDTCDELIVNGELDLGPDSDLQINQVVSTDGTPESWLIITASGGITGNFAYSNVGQQSMHGDLDNPSMGDYTVIYPYMPH